MMVSLQEERRLDIDTDRQGERHVTLEVGDIALSCYTEACSQPPDARKARKDPALESYERAWRRRHLEFKTSWTSSFQNCEGMFLLSFLFFVFFLFLLS